MHLCRDGYKLEASLSSLFLGRFTFLEFAYPFQTKFSVLKTRQQVGHVT